MIEYILDNKEWIFSGIGITVIVVLFYVSKGVFQKYRSSSDDVPLESNEKDHSAISLEDFYEGLSDRSKTLLQRRDFMDKYGGCIVQWEGVVTSVAPVQKMGGEMDELSIFFQSKKHASEKHKVAVATFPISAKRDLLELSAGDFVKIQGKLSFFGPDQIPSIEEAKLVSFNKEDSY